MGTRATSLRAATALALLVPGYLIVQFIGGAQRSPLVPPLPEGVQVPAWARAGTRWLGLDGLGHTPLTLLSIGLLFALIGSFVMVLVEAWRGRVGTAPLAVAIVASLALSVGGPLVLSRDVHSYAIYGRIFAVHGENPYAKSPGGFPEDAFLDVVSREWVDTRSVYGPAFTLASAALAGAARSPASVILAFKVLAGVALGLSALLAALATRAVRRERAAFAAAVVGLNPVLVVHAVGGGHNDTLVGFLLAAAALTLVASLERLTGDPSGPSTLRANRGLWFAVTVLLSLAALVKVVAALPLLMWLWFMSRRGAGDGGLRSAALHAVVAVLVAAAATAPFFAGWRSVTSLATLASLQGWASPARLVARGAQALGRATAGSGGASALGTLAYAAFLIAAGLLIWRLLRSGGPGHASGIAGAWGAALLLFVLASPYLLPWYVAWFAPLLALVRDRVLVGVGVATAALLALTGVPTEPGPNRALWEWMVLAVHYAAAPVVLGLFLVAAARVLGWRGGASAVSPDDLHHPSSAETTVTSRVPNARA